MQQDSQAIVDLLIPPMAGTDPDIHAISYFTRARTYGVVPPRTPAPDANETLSETHVRTFLAAADTDLATALPDLYGYQRVGEARVCNSTYVILRVPDG